MPGTSRRVLITGASRGIGLATARLLHSQGHQPVGIARSAPAGWPGRTSYGAAKAALDFCTRAWAGELATSGITVNAVAPGPTETELFRASSPPGSPGEKLYLDRVPQRRLGQPGEIAAGIGFLLSDEAGFITGQTLRIDGGGSIGA